MWKILLHNCKKFVIIKKGIKSQQEEKGTDYGKKQSRSSNRRPDYHFGF